MVDIQSAMAEIRWGKKERTRNVGQCATWWSPCRTGGALCSTPQTLADAHY